MSSTRSISLALTHYFQSNLTDQHQLDWHLVDRVELIRGAICLRRINAPSSYYTFDSDTREILLAACADPRRKGEFYTLINEIVAGLLSFPEHRQFRIVVSRELRGVDLSSIYKGMILQEDDGKYEIEQVFTIEERDGTIVLVLHGVKTAINSRPATTFAALQTNLDVAFADAQFHIEQGRPKSRILSPIAESLANKMRSQQNAPAAPLRPLRRSATPTDALSLLRHGSNSMSEPFHPFQGNIYRIAEEPDADVVRSLASAASSDIFNPEDAVRPLSSILDTPPRVIVLTGRPGATLPDATLARINAATPLRNTSISQAVADAARGPTGTPKAAVRALAGAAPSAAVHTERGAGPSGPPRVDVSAQTGAALRFPDNPLPGAVPFGTAVPDVITQAGATSLSRVIADAERGAFSGVSRAHVSSQGGAANTMQWRWIVSKELIGIDLSHFYVGRLFREKGKTYEITKISALNNGGQAFIVIQASETQKVGRTTTRDALNTEFNDAYSDAQEYISHGRPAHFPLTDLARCIADRYR